MPTGKRYPVFGLSKKILSDIEGSKSDESVKRYPNLGKGRTASTCADIAFLIGGDAIAC